MNEKIKYPRTYHLPYSPTMTPDDKRLESDEQFKNMAEVGKITDWKNVLGGRKMLLLIG